MSGAEEAAEGAGGLVGLGVCAAGGAVAEGAPGSTALSSRFCGGCGRMVPNSFCGRPKYTARAAQRKSPRIRRERRFKILSERPDMALTWH